MTHSQKSYIKSNWMTLANLIILISLSFRTGYIQSMNESGIKKNKENLLEHKIDESVHMSFEKKIKIFVPRIELDGRLKNIEDAQKLSNDKQEKIYQLLLKK